MLCYARSTRGPVAVTALPGTLTTPLVSVQTFLISVTLSPIVSGTASLIDVWSFIMGIAVTFACRVLTIVAHETVSTRAAITTVRELRGRAMDAATMLESRWRVIKDMGTTTLLSIRLRDLRSHFVSFPPQLVLVCIVTPAVFGVILLLDSWSVLIAFLVIPLVPVFMILVGRFT